MKKTKKRKQYEEMKKVLESIRKINTNDIYERVQEIEINIRSNESYEKQINDFINKR